MVKCLPEFDYFTVFLKNRNFIFKIRKSKVTDYAALTFIKHSYSALTSRNRIRLDIGHYVNSLLARDMPSLASPSRINHNYTTLTNFSSKYPKMCKVYTDEGGINSYTMFVHLYVR